MRRARSARNHSLWWLTARRALLSQFWSGELSIAIGDGEELKPTELLTRVTQENVESSDRRLMGHVAKQLENDSIVVL